MELVEVLRRKDVSELGDGAKLYKDGSNAALLVKEDGYCFVIFDTTESFSMADWSKNIDPRTSEICSLPNERYCCDARRGYVRAYSKPDYKVSLDEAIIIECFSKGHDVILSGHSAGGATAAVAAVALDEINPTVITFGQPASLVGDCSVINEDRYYHWVNTDLNNSGRNLDYDPIPDLSLTSGTRHYGHRIVMGNDKENVVVYRDGEVPGMVDWGFDAWAHESDEYIDRLKQYDGSLGTDGWKAGLACNIDDECISKKCERETGDPSYWRSGTCQE